jgi:hypothetical protein
VSKCSPRKGYLALESEGAECHFKNIRIKELPSTNPKPEEVAQKDEGFQSLFNALDLTGWKTDKDSWKVVGGKLVAVGPGNLTGPKLAESGAVLFFDWKVPAKSGGDLTVTVGGTDVITKAEKPGSWQRTRILVSPKPGGSVVIFKPIAGLEIMNVFAQTLPEKK